MSKRRLLGTGLGVALSGVLLFLALRSVDGGDVRETLAAADPWLVAAALLPLSLMYVAQGRRWAWIAQRETSARSSRCTADVVASIALNNVIPGRPGDFLRVHWLARATGLTHARALATVVVDRASDVLVLVAALAVAYPAVAHPAWLNRLMGIAAAGAVLMIGLLLAARRHDRRRRGRPVPLPRRRLVAAASGAVAGVGALVDRRSFVVVASLSAAAWLSWSTAAWLAARALDVPLSPLEMALVAGVVNLGVAIPSSPGFVGTYQWLWIAALGLVGTSASTAFAFAVLFHALWFVPTTGIGLLILVWRNAGGAPRKVRRAPMPDWRARFRTGTRLPSPPGTGQLVVWPADSGKLARAAAPAAAHHTSANRVEG